MGRRNNSGEANWLFNKPTDVAFSKNGDIFVTDGYGNSRVVKFDRNGNFIKAWGTYGTGPGEFMLPHSVVIDKNDRVYVGDRENARIQIFDADGHFLTQWTGIGYPYGLWIAPDQHIWMVDGGFDRIIELDQAGKILGAIGSPGPPAWTACLGAFSAQSVRNANLIVADVLNWRFQVFVPTKASGKLSEYVPTERHFLGSNRVTGTFSIRQGGQRSRALRGRGRRNFPAPKETVMSGSRGSTLEIGGDSPLTNGSGAASRRRPANGGQRRVEIDFPLADIHALR